MPVHYCIPLPSCVPASSIWPFPSDTFVVQRHPFAQLFVESKLLASACGRPDFASFPCICAVGQDELAAFLPRKCTASAFCAGRFEDSATKSRIQGCGSLYMLKPSSEVHGMFGSQHRHLPARHGPQNQGRLSVPRLRMRCCGNLLRLLPTLQKHATAIFMPTVQSSCHYGRSPRRTRGSSCCKRTRCFLVRTEAAQHDRCTAAEVLGTGDAGRTPGRPPCAQTSLGCV